MSVESAVSDAQSPDLPGANTSSGPQWMISSGADLFFILLTPLLAAPAIMLLSSSVVGVQAATISLVVASFFALGHHLPGMIRAYGDKDLFQRFKWRFILAPPLVALAYYPLYNYHFGLYRLIILSWATWHGFMQVYGFVRIYDAKVGSVAKSTANWDWMVCLWGFVTPQLLRAESLTQLMSHWHSIGGPLLSAGAISAVRWACVAMTVFVVVGFAVNYAIQWVRGPKPNPLKVLMLASGIGTWWFAMCFVDQLILGIALFDICHDVQYNAIVWMYNRRLVNTNPQASAFLKYVFRRGAVLLYLGLITAYGAIGLIPPLVANGTVSAFFYGMIFTSTILHYYYDGFIWKVRESANQSNLGLADNAGRQYTISLGQYSHALKWSPAVIALGLLFASDIAAGPLTTAEKNAIESEYADKLMARPEPPPDPEVASWLYDRYTAMQRISTAVPDDHRMKYRTAVMQANFGNTEEAIERLEDLISQQPNNRAANVTLGKIHLFRGNLDRAAKCYEQVLALSHTADQRSRANLTLGEIALKKDDPAVAQSRFDAALKDDPELASHIPKNMQHSEAMP